MVFLLACPIGRTAAAQMVRQRACGTFIFLLLTLDALPELYATNE
jgi:hypothetical protein